MQLVPGRQEHDRAGRKGGQAFVVLMLSFYFSFFDALIFLHRILNFVTIEKEITTTVRETFHDNGGRIKGHPLDASMSVQVEKVRLWYF